MQINGLRDYRATVLGQAARDFLKQRMPDCEDIPEKVDRLKSPGGDDGSADELMRALADYRLGSILARTNDVDPNARDKLAGALRLWLTFHGDSENADPDSGVVGFALADFFDNPGHLVDAGHPDPFDAEAANFTPAERSLVHALKFARGVKVPEHDYRYIDSLDEELISALREWADAHPQADDRSLIRIELAELLGRATRSIDEQLQDGDIDVDYPDAGDAYELGRMREAFDRVGREFTWFTGPVGRMHPNDAHLIQAAIGRVNDEIQRDLDTGDIDDAEDREVAELRMAAYDGINAQASLLTTTAELEARYTEPESVSPGARG